MITQGADHPRHAGRADSIVACTIGDEQFALRGADACEIARAEVMRRLTSLDGVVGSLYVNRERVPVYALAATLGRPGAAAAGHPTGNHVVVTRGATGMIGWLVDRIARPTLAEAAHVLPLPPIVGAPATRWFEGLVRIGDRAMLLVSPPNLDPRARATTTPADDAFEAAVPAVPSMEDATPPLVLLFSSPALPDCRAARFALSARRVAAVIRSQAVTVVPGSAAHVAGVIVWRDAVVPVIDGHRQTDRRPAESRDRLVVARCGGSLNGALVAFPIGTDVTLHQPTRADRQMDGAEPGAPFIAGMFSVGGRPVALLDLEAAVAALAG